MTIGRDDLSKSETVTVAAIEGGVPLLVEAREVIAAFQAMIRKKSIADLDPWLEKARTGLVTSLATASSKTVLPSALRSLRHGRMAKPKGRSPSSNW
jgi:hypothetical protein